MEMKTTMRYHLTPQNGYYQKEWLLSKRQQIASVGKVVEKREPLCTVGGKVNWSIHYEKNMEIPQKIKNGITILFRNSTPGYLSKENENMTLKRYMHPYVYCNIIYNSHNMKATEVPINR